MKKYQRLSYSERVRIETYLSLGKSISDIARLIKRHKSSVSREVNAWVKNDVDKYNAEIVHWCALDERQYRHVGRKLDKYPRLLKFVRSKLKLHWSPEQIAHYLKKNFPNDSTMNVSHESIYSYIYLLPRGELKKELISYLRQEKKTRYSRVGKGVNRGKIPDRICIEERPAEVEDRVIAGHWESDLIIGKDHKSAIGTIVERTTRTVIIVKLKSSKAAEVRKAFAREVKKIPEQMRLTMTHDNGYEMSQHRLFTKQTKMRVYFAHPYASWERGTNENTNGLIRDFFPKGTDFNLVSRYKLKKVQHMLNERPRKILDWDCPKEVFNKMILDKCA